MGQRVILFAVAICALTLAGCKSGEEAPVSKEGSTTVQTKGGAGAATGMSANDLSVPGGSESTNLPGSKSGGN